MRISMILLFVCGLFSGLGALSGCDADPGPGATGTVTLTDGEGVDFDSGVVLDPGNFANSDLFASRNGAALKLSTGGASPTTNNLANWFKNGGGVVMTFDSLAQVPMERPDETMVESLVKAKAGVGFVVQRHSGLYTRGWIAAADAGSVTIQFEPLP